MNFYCFFVIIYFKEGDYMYKKLVRDKIADIIKSNGETPIIRILSNNEYKLEL